MASFATQLTIAKEKLGIDFTLTTPQVQALQSVYDGKSTVCLLPTGSGKSVIYQLTPFLLENKVENAITLVISPLNSIMQDQVLKLSRQGVKACYLNMEGRTGESFMFQSRMSESTESSFDEREADSEPEHGSEPLKMSVPIETIVSEGYQLIYAHPEAFLTSPQGRALIRTPSFRRRICCVAIDEAHMIAEWGENFRPDFSRLNALLALCRNATTLVLTATASKQVMEKIVKDLALRDPACIREHPDRANIMYFKFKRSPARRQYNDLDEVLLEISKGLRSMEREYPITITYTSLGNIAYSYRYLEEAMREKQYVGEPVPENRLFGMYHQCYSQRMKTHIVSELGTEKSRVRFILASVALGMGLDSPAVRKVIHFGSPTSIEKYLQETGRAGRDGQQSEAVLYYNPQDIRSNRPGQAASMSEYCKSEDTCLRQFLMQYLDFQAPEDRILCQCCQFCRPLCDCISCIGDQLHRVQVSNE